MNDNKKLWTIIAISLAGLCLLTCGGLGLIVLFAPNIYQFSLDRSSLNVGTTAPDFELTELKG